jgi:hypothetical protein
MEADAIQLPLQPGSQTTSSQAALAVRRHSPGRAANRWAVDGPKAVLWSCSTRTHPAMTEKNWTDINQSKRESYIPSSPCELKPWKTNQFRPITVVIVILLFWKVTVFSSSNFSVLSEFCKLTFEIPSTSIMFFFRGASRCCFFSLGCVPAYCAIFVFMIIVIHMLTVFHMRNWKSINK